MKAQSPLSDVSVSLPQPPPLLGPYPRKARRVNRHVLDMMASEMSRQVELEYADDVISYMNKLQQTTIPDTIMMDLQPEIEWHMRPYLLDFLVDTHLGLRLQPQTLYLAITLLDRYCSKRVVYRKHYQLVGCTALWIAAKYEDKKSRIPTLNDLCNMCCKAYDGDMFIQMEGFVLNTLDWSIGHPTIESYLQLYLGNEINPTLRHICQYLSEITLYHRSFLSLSPSTIASTCYKMAKHILNDEFSVPTQQLSIEENQTMTLLYQYMSSPTKTLSRKYSSSTLSQATYLVNNFITRQQSANLLTPPTPPPSAHLLTPPSLSSSSASSIANSPGSPPIYNATSKRIEIKIPAPFKSEGYLTPPCTPDEFNGPANNRTNSIVSSSGGLPPPYQQEMYTKPTYTSIPMEYTRSMDI